MCSDCSVEEYVLPTQISQGVPECCVPQLQQLQQTRVGDMQLLSCEVQGLNVRLVPGLRDDCQFLAVWWQLLFLVFIFLARILQHKVHCKTAI